MTSFMLGRARGLLLALLVGSLVPAAMLASCQSGEETLETCGQIPGFGCPIGRGGTCDDPTCSGLYNCLDGGWVETMKCPRRATSGVGAGVGGSAATGLASGVGVGGAGGNCTPFMFDHDGEAQNCEPPLENPPDCPAAAADNCLQSACLTGCSDFWLCMKEGWVPVGYCDDDGGFHDTQPEAGH